MTDISNEARRLILALAEFAQETAPYDIGEAAGLTPKQNEKAWDEILSFYGPEDD